MTLAVRGPSRLTYPAPLVALDEILELTSAGIRTVKAVAGNEAFFAGHFPDFPIFPGVFIIEAVHQAARAYVAAQWPGVVDARLTEVSSVRFLSPVRPGEVLEIACRCDVRLDDGELRVRADCACRERPVAVVALRYAVRPPG
jgi:3-hydroxyacyl-[acyl-carrier-protein] dehydratase